MTDSGETSGPYVERLGDGSYIVHDGERKLVLPASTTPEDLTREIVTFYPPYSRDESLMARLSRYLWPFGKG